MKSRLPVLLAILALFPCLSPRFGGFTSAAQSRSQEPSAAEQAQDPLDVNQDVNPDEQEPRVARLESLEGGVSFQRAGDTEWVAAVRNLPLLPGDQVYTAAGAGAQIQLDVDSYIWLSENSVLTFADFADRSAQFELTQGSAIFQVKRLSDAFGRFEIDSPTSAVVLNADGLYRVDVQSSGGSVFAVKHGEADVTTSEGDLTVRDGHQLIVGPVGSDQLQIAEIDPYQRWETTSDAYGTEASNYYSDKDPINYDSGSTTGVQTNPVPDYVSSYESQNNGLYGLDDLSSYGTWTNIPSYGNCWLPNVGSGWAPYRLGEWVWIPAAGWTWLSNEPWGWAPYHYGRWEMFPGLGWAWVPGFGPGPFNYGYPYYRWNPGTVNFFNYWSGQNRVVAWYPVPPHSRWYPGRWQRPPARRVTDPVAALLPTVGSRIARVGGVSVLPIASFNGSVRARPVAAEPVVASMLDHGKTASGAVEDGLPEMTPVRTAVAPIRTVGGIAVVKALPPQAAVARPVVTRRLLASQGGTTNISSGPSQVHREHRLVEPKPITARGFSPSLTETERGVVTRRNAETAAQAGRFFVPGSGSQRIPESRTLENNRVISPGVTRTNNRPTYIRPIEPESRREAPVRSYPSERTTRSMPSQPRVAPAAPHSGGGHSGQSGGGGGGHRH